MARFKSSPRKLFVYKGSKACSHHPKSASMLQFQLYLRGSFSRTWSCVDILPQAATMKLGLVDGGRSNGTLPVGPKLTHNQLPSDHFTVVLVALPQSNISHPLLAFTLSLSLGLSCLVGSSYVKRNALQIAWVTGLVQLHWSFAKQRAFLHEVQRKKTFLDTIEDVRTGLQEPTSS